MLTKLMRLGRDAELRYTQSGEPVANLALAYNYGQKDQNGKRPSQWCDASLWGDRATKLQPYLLKGAALVVTLDDVHVHTFQKGDGTMGTSLRARVVGLEFAGSPQQEGQGNSQAQPQQRQQSNQQRGNDRAQQRQAPPPQSGPRNFNDFDDDIPF